MIKNKVLKIIIGIIIIINVIIYFNIYNYIHILEMAFNEKIIVSPIKIAFICVIFCLISIFLVLDILLVTYKGKIKNNGVKFKADDGTFGTADWLSKEEIENILTTEDLPGIILGKENEKIVKLPFESNFNKNICVFGSSRKYENNWVLTNKLTWNIKI